MEYEIPGGSIIETPASWVLKDNAAEVFAACGAGHAFNFAAWKLSVETERPAMTMRMSGDIVRLCDVKMLDVDGLGLVVCVDYGDDQMAYLYVREGRHDATWQMATHALVLPVADLENNDRDNSLGKHFGRVLAYLGLAAANNWFPPEFK